MFTTALFAWLSVACIMSIVWLLFLYTQYAGIVDAFWSVVIAVTAFWFSGLDVRNSIKIIIQVLLLIWSVRLFVYLFINRVRVGAVDKRYDAISQSWRIPRNIGFFFNFQMQGILAMFIAMPFIFIHHVMEWSVHVCLGLVLVVIGIICESIADYQLHRFKKLHDRGVCQVGFWYYSRHPNYFFEWVIWLGFAVIGGGVSWGLVGFFSPILLLFLMLKVTVPVTENTSIASRGKLYKDYQSYTSVFVPWFKRSRI